MRQSDNSEAASTIRPLQHADVTFLTELWVGSWQDVAWPEASPAIDFEARRAWIAAFLGDEAHATLVALRADQPVGFVTLEGGYLHQLVVAPAAKGDGTATALLDAAKGQVPAGLVLDVNQANGRAVRFYRREGFVIAGAGKNAASGLPTWQMRWP